VLVVPCVPFRELLYYAGSGAAPLETQ
jgi:hypothetical protein